MADSATHPTHGVTGHYDEKVAAPVAPATYEAKPKVEADDEDEDIDALIEDLESQDGHVEEEEEDTATPGGEKTSRRLISVSWSGLSGHGAWLRFDPAPEL
jgi:H+-transporting ATPase